MMPSRPIIVTAIIQSEHRKRILADNNPGCSNPNCDQRNSQPPNTREFASTIHSSVGHYRTAKEGRAERKQRDFIYAVHQT